MAQGICEMILLKLLLNELRVLPHGPIKLYCDDKATMSIAHNSVPHKRTKYAEIDHHFVKEEIKEELMCIMYIPTKQ